MQETDHGRAAPQILAPAEGGPAAPVAVNPWARQKSSDAVLEPSFRLPDGVLWNVLSFWPPQRPPTFSCRCRRYRTKDRGPGVFFATRDGRTGRFVATAGTTLQWSTKRRWRGPQLVTPRRPDPPWPPQAPWRSLDIAAPGDLNGNRQLSPRTLDARPNTNVVRDNCLKTHRPRISAAAARRWSCCSSRTSRRVGL